MAVQKSKKTRSKRGMRRSHDSISAPALSIDSQSGETHARHQISAGGYYKGKQVVIPKVKEKKVIISWLIKIGHWILSGILVMMIYF